MTVTLTLRVALMALPPACSGPQSYLRTNRRTQNHFSPIKQNFVFSFCTMVKEVNPETLKAVLDSWEGLKNTEDYKKQAGEKVMKFLFEKCPKALPMFGYDIESEIDGEFTSDPKFVAHSMQLIGMFDQALQMLGPNGKLLAEQIAELGEKHYNYGVRAEMFPIMGKGLMAMLEDQLGDSFTNEVKAAWQVVFGAISVVDVD